MVRTLPSNAGSAGSIPGQGATVPYASQPQNLNIIKRYGKKFSEDFREKIYSSYLWGQKICQCIFLPVVEMGI